MEDGATSYHLARFSGLPACLRGTVLPASPPLSTPLPPSLSHHTPAHYPSLTPTTSPTTHPLTIHPHQVVGPVLWEKSLKTLLDKGLTESYEVGPGKVIAGIMKRIDKNAKIENIVA